MPKALYLDCFSGISGDMFLGALLDLGVPLSEVESAVARLQLPDHLHLHAGRQLRGAVSGIKFDVHTHPHEQAAAESQDHGHGEHHHDHGHGHEHHHGHHHSHGRSHAAIKELIGNSSLDPWIKKRASSLFHRIAEVEAKIHGQSVEEVHFHEVGALDSIVDIIGACAALHYLQITTILASDLVEGTGTLKCDHGSFPIPSPATLGLLQNSGARIKQLDLPYELITPTGAALLAEFAGSFGPLNHFQIEKIGWGLGTRDTPGRPNALRVLLGESAAATSILERDTVAVLETNLDDCSGESLGFLGELLFQAGAYDVSYSPITMKKSRPAWQLQVIAPLDLRASLAELILRQSSAFGLRVTEVERFKLAREIKTVPTSYGEVRVKLGKIGTEIIKSVPEYEDCRRLALENKVALETVYQAALAASR